MGVGPHASGRGWGPARNQIMLIESPDQPHYPSPDHARLRWPRTRDPASYSALSAIIGSTRVARRAGTSVARNDTAVITAMTVA